MRKLFLLPLFVLVLAACSSGPSDAECRLNWTKLRNGVSQALVSDSEMASWTLNQIMLPNTVGEVAQQCLERGWRPPGLD